MMEKYYLSPVDGKKSFYGKCYVTISKDGTRTLYSYDTAIVKQTSDGKLTRIWDGWSATTGRHIKAFCGLDKKGFMALSY